MKKVFNVLFTLLIMFLFKQNVFAEKFTCDYIFGEDINYQVEFDIDNDSAEILNKDEGYENALITQVVSYKNSFLTGEISSYNVNECPMLYLKVEEISSTKFTGGRYISNTFTLYSDSYIREKDNDKCVQTRNETCIQSIFGQYTYFYDGVLKEGSRINEGKQLVTSCPSYNMVHKELTQAIEYYNSCSNDLTCIASAEIKISNSIKDIKQMCNRLFENRNVYIKDYQGNKIEDPCIQSCLSYSTTIEQELPKEYIKKYNECGFSDKLMSWIQNIMKWIKYILPVIVIITGVFDFIKAMASEKDDEMKKTQSKFIKRLIAAALTFIVPLILEFILEKMGFSSKSCGLF